MPLVVLLRLWQLDLRSELDLNLPCPTCPLAMLGRCKLLHRLVRLSLTLLFNAMGVPAWLCLTQEVAWATQLALTEGQDVLLMQLFC